MKFLRKVVGDLVTNLPATKLDYTEIIIDTRIGQADFGQDSVDILSRSTEA